MTTFSITRQQSALLALSAATMPGGELVEGYNPVSITVQGKTAADKRISVVNAGLTHGAQQYLANKKGKVGQAVRDLMSLGGARAIAAQAFQGDFKPLAQALAVELGENVNIRNRADYNAIKFTLNHKFCNLKNEGYSASGKPTQARLALEACIRLIDQCDGIGAALKAQYDAAKEAKAAAEAAGAEVSVTDVQGE